MLLEELKIFSEKYPPVKQEGTASLLMCGSIWTKGFCGKPYFKNYKTFQPGWFWIFNDKHGIHIGDERTIPGTCEEQLKKYLKNTKLDIIKKYYQIEKQICKEYKKHLKENLEKITNKEIRKKIIKITNTVNEFSSTTVFSEGMNQEILSKYYTQENGKEKEFKLFEELAQLPLFESIAVRRDKEKLKIINTRKKDYKKIQWVFSDYYSSKTPEEIKEILKKTGKKQLIEEINKNNVKVNLKKMKSKKIFSKQIQKIIEFSQICMKMRDNRRDAFSKAETIMFNLAREYFKRKKINQEDATYSYYTDFEKEIDSKKYTEIINKRKKGIIVYLVPGKKLKTLVEYCDFSETREKAMDIVNKNRPNIEELTGAVASKGTARGKVCIILTAHDFHKFNEGDVIVASMTRPEYVPLMKKAVAIVTDEGGITCHAAIVSRELKKHA